MKPFQSPTETQPRIGADIAIQIRDLTVNYRQSPAIAGISLDVRAGDFLGIIGPNGGGKTTLIKAILGLVQPTEGAIRIFGEKVSKARHQVGYVPQLAEFDRSFPLTVEEVVLTGRLPAVFRPLHRYTNRDKDFVLCLLEKLGIDHLRGQLLAGLSGGEFQRMLIARALAAEPAILLLDEPTAFVDAPSRDAIYAFLGQLNQRVTILMVSHDLLAVATHVKSMACLNRQLVYQGSPANSDQAIAAIYGCFQEPVPWQDSPPLAEVR